MGHDTGVRQPDVLGEGRALPQLPQLLGAQSSHSRDVTLSLGQTLPQLTRTQQSLMSFIKLTLWSN